MGRNGFERYVRVESVFVGAEFTAKPSFFKTSERFGPAFGFNLIDSQEKEYRGFLEGVIEADFETEFYLAIYRVYQRKELSKRPTVKLAERILNVGDKLIVKVGIYDESRNSFGGNFKNYMLNVSPSFGPLQNVVMGDLVLVEVNYIFPGHKFANVRSLSPVNAEEYEANKGKVIRP